MTATERLRELLDERGVPWKDYGHENHTWWGEWHAENRSSVNGLFLKVEGVVTPEHAVDATLGDAPSLPYWWTHDGTLHIELPKLPDSISVRLPDQRDREGGSARVWQYTRDSGAHLRARQRKASIRIEYFELSDHWSWEVTVGTHNAYGVESDHDNAFAAAEFALEDMLAEEVDA